MSENLTFPPPEPKPSVLLIHQDPPFREALVRQLALRGYRVKGVDTSLAAIEQVRGNPPQVVILDQDAAGPDGRQALREMKQLGVSAPVILLIPNGSRVPEELRSQLPIADYVYKPCGLDELITKLEAARGALSRPKSAGVAQWLARLWSGLSRSLSKGLS